MIEDVRLIKERIRQAQNHQKSCSDQRRHDLKFNVGDTVFIRVTFYKYVMRFDKKDNLASRFVGSFEVLKHIGKVAY